MKRQTFIVFLGLVLSSASAGAADSSWEKTGDSNGVRVYRKEVPDQPVVAFRGEAVIDAPILRVASVLVDEDRSKEWVDSLVVNKILRKLNDHDYVLYNHVGMPFILKDREFVSIVHVTPDQEKQTFDLAYTPTEDPDAPKTDYVRGLLHKSEFFLRSIDGGKRCEIEVEILCDPKGAIPKWLVNLFQASWPENTIEALRKQVAKPDVKDDARLMPFFPKAN